jgi:hypothetical protein
LISARISWAVKGLVFLFSIAFATAKGGRQM